MRSYATLIAVSALLGTLDMDARACSRCLWAEEGQPVLVGRNMDWTERMGTTLWVMPRGVDRQGMTPGTPAKWTSKHGSVVSVVWDAAAADGMNEAGLNANLLYLAETQYGDGAPTREGLSVALWAQYFLDNFATVADAVEASRSLEVRPFELVHKGQAVDAPIHVSLADATGDSAIIEILDGKTTIHHGPQYTVMTNSPPYDEQLVLLKQYDGLGGTKPLPGTADAADRFVRGAYYLNQLPEEPVSYQEAVAGVLSVMRNMSTPIGFNDSSKPNISATQWRTISDLTNKRYYFELTNMPNVVWVDLSALNLEEGAPIQTFDLASHLEASGEISGRFRPAKPFEFQDAGSAVDWKPAKSSR